MNSTATLSRLAEMNRRVAIERRRGSPHMIKPEREILRRLAEKDHRPAAGRALAPSPGVPSAFTR